VTSLDGDRSLKIGLLGAPPLADDTCSGQQSSAVRPAVHGAGCFPPLHQAVGWEVPDLGSHGRREKHKPDPRVWLSSRRYLGYLGAPSHNDLHPVEHVVCMAERAACCGAEGFFPNQEVFRLYIRRLSPLPWAVSTTPKSDSGRNHVHLNGAGRCLCRSQTELARPFNGGR